MSNPYSRFLGLKISLIVILLVLGLSYAAFQFSKARTVQLFGGLTSHIETKDKIIALTFDDAPSTHTDAILQILQEKGVKGTFYTIGKAIEEHPTEAKAIVQQGHELGNHSYSHPRFLLKSQSFIEQEIETTNQLIRDSGYTGEITFRPPFGKKLIGLPWYLSRHNIKTITWDVEPDTKYAGNAEQMLEYTLKQAQPGSIILLHPFCEAACAADREVLPKIIDELKTQGYTFVTISELLRR
jgi:peptidoglycan/xylan/chitin deacetylase (PgdA/CDA1 family)